MFGEFCVFCVECRGEWSLDWLDDTDEAPALTGRFSIDYARLSCADLPSCASSSHASQQQGCGARMIQVDD